MFLVSELTALLANGILRGAISRSHHANKKNVSAVTKLRSLYLHCSLESTKILAAAARTMILKRLANEGAALKKVTLELSRRG